MKESIVSFSNVIYSNEEGDGKIMKTNQIVLQQDIEFYQNLLFYK